MFWKSARKLVFGLLIVWGLSYGWHLFAQQGGGFTPPPKPTGPKVEKTAASAPDGMPFAVGEKLTYSVSWMNFPLAAKLDLEVVEAGAFFGQDGFQLRTKVETLSRVRALFVEMDNQYTSYVSQKTFLPYRIENAIRQGARQVDETVIFDQARRQVRFSDDTTLAVGGDAFDLTGLLYALRTRPLTEGADFSLLAVYGKQALELEAEVKKRERITAQAGNYSAVRIDLTPKDKKLSKYRVRVWLSDDAQRLPVVLVAQLPFGEVRAELLNVTFLARRPAASPAPTPMQPPGKLSTQPSATGEKEPSEANGHFPFVLGERLNYDIAWGNFSLVGKASFEVRQKGFLGDRRVYEFVGEATSIGVARTLVNVNDQLISYADAHSLAPVKTETRLREGRRSKFNTATYDWSARAASLPNGTRVELKPGTLDLLSLFYAVRAARLETGAAKTYYFLDANQRLQSLQTRVVKQEAIGGPLGTRDALQLDILSPDGAQLLAQAWISNDERRLPLYIAVRPRFGELRFQLTGVVNPR